MTTFDNREQAYETKYARDEEFRFKVHARRNKLVGLWAAEKLGKSGADAEAYAKEVVMSDFEKPGDEDVVEKILRDFHSAGVDADAHAIRKQLSSKLDEAKQQLMKM